MAEAAKPTSAYAAAGVDIAAGERAVDLMKRHVARTARPELVADASGFAGLFRLDTSKYTAPVLATSTDGVGTKVLLAQRMDKHDTIGIDLVGMVVDDLVVSGAEPLFMTDYIATGAVVPEKIAEIVGGIAEGCAQAGCALIGGETAEHPGAMRPDEYDLAGAGTGVVEADAILGPGRVRDGDAVIAMASSGPHSNGYSLIRRVVDQTGLELSEEVPELGGVLGEVLLTRPGSTPGTASSWPRGSRCTPTRTSPAAGSPPTWSARCPKGSARSWTGPPGRPSRSSGSSPSAAGSPGGHGGHVQHGCRHGGAGGRGGRRAGPGRAGRAGRSRLARGDGALRCRRGPAERRVRLRATVRDGVRKQ